MAGVRPDRVRLALLAVERHRVVALVLDPEALLEPLLEGARLAQQPLRQSMLAADRRQGRHPTLRIEDVALDLGERDRRLRLDPVAIADRVARVLPALVEQAARRTALV